MLFWLDRGGRTTTLSGRSNNPGGASGILRGGFVMGPTTPKKQRSSGFGPLGTLFHGLCDGGHCNSAVGGGTASVAGGVWAQRQAGDKARPQGRGLSCKTLKRERLAR